MYQKQWVKSNSTGVNAPLWYMKYPCSSPSGVYVATLRYLLGTLRSPLRISGIPALKTFSALDATVRFDLMSRYNGPWLDSTWVVLGLSSRCRASYRSFCSLRDFARLERWSNSLAQTIFCCSLLLWWGDKNSGYEEGQWGPIATDDESEPWSNSKGTQLRGIGLSGRDVVVLQEIEPKVRFLILQGLYTYKR